MIHDEQLIKDCIKLNKVAQRELYNKYAPTMRVLSARYTTNSADAKDILQDGFIKVFTNIKKFTGAGTLEGWIKKIIINTAISHYHKNKKKAEITLTDNVDTSQDYKFYNDFDNEKETNSLFELIEHADFSEEELMDSLNVLKADFRIVFNLFFLEDYSHNEISEILNIDEKTSRTRLFRARQKMQKHLHELSMERVQNSNTIRKIY